MQRVVGIAPGYEDLNDHDEPRRDPVLAMLASRLEAERSGCAPLAGNSMGGPRERRCAGRRQRFH